MEKSVLNDKWVLIVDDQPDTSMVLEEEILRIAPNCHVDKPTHCKNATELMASFAYDLVILDSLSFRSSELINRAVLRFPASQVVVLTSLYSDSEALKGFVKIGARICPPKENFREIVPFLEDMVRHENLIRWKHLFEDLTGLFRGRIKPGCRGRADLN